MTRCCDGPLGAVRPLEAPSWLTARAADDGEHRVAVAAGVGEPLQQQQPTPSAQPVPSASAANDLQRPSGGEAALAAELDEGAGRGHHGDAAGQREVALAAAQRLGGQVQGDQGGGAGGVDGDGRALEAEGVGDAAGGDAAGAAGAQVALERRRAARRAGAA